ncbi:uncharacterized protein BCR38DRAFT_355773, partial [Pseudomassariella vexata]
SDNYAGDITNSKNLSANISHDENCSVFITGLPPNCSIQSLLGSIRNCGRIYSCNINPPNSDSRTAAAKVVFFDRQSTERFLKKARLGEFTVGKYCPMVRMNRVRVAAQKDKDMRFSRVVKISGPKEIVNRQYLEKVVFVDFYYDLDVVMVCRENEDSCEMEYHFSSFRAQAQKAMLNLRNWKRWAMVSRDEGSEKWLEVQISHGVDPCH